VAALEGRLPAAYEVEVAFKKPILLPATVTFGSEAQRGTTRFSVRDRKGAPHLDGTIRPAKKAPGQRKKK
jgi:hypothetical protein